MNFLFQQSYEEWYFLNFFRLQHLRLERLRHLPQITQKSHMSPELYQNLREESPFSYSLESCSQYTACLVVEIFLSIYLQLPKKYHAEIIMCCSYFLKEVFYHLVFVCMYWACTNSKGIWRNYWGQYIVPYNSFQS